MAEFCHPEFGCDCHEDKRIELCESCEGACGYRWPTATDCNTDHDWVERCDACDRFEDDNEAHAFLTARLQDMGYEYDTGYAHIRSIGRKAPYIDNVRREP